jgi:hypothetical protein
MCRLPLIAQGTNERAVHPELFRRTSPNAMEVTPRKGDGASGGTDSLLLA